MGRAPGPLDRGEVIDTFELLSAIDAFGKHWPAQLSHYTIEAVSRAVGRELMAGMLVDGSCLSGQGRAMLVRLQAEQLSAAGPAAGAADSAAVA